MRRILRGQNVTRNQISSIDPRATKLEVINLQPHCAPIYKITGTPSSCENTLTSHSGREVDTWVNVPIPGYRGCSWVYLIDALQAQERQSPAWDRGWESRGLDDLICYFIQKRSVSWDAMPQHVSKPFATTTLSSLVEIMSMLGLIWTEFDVKNSDLAAEGNGYMVTSYDVQGTGTFCTFSPADSFGRSFYEKDRVIPCLDVKRLCFGEVPSLFDGMAQKLQVGPGQIERCIAKLLPNLSPEHREKFLASESEAEPFVLSREFVVL